MTPRRSNHEGTRPTRVKGRDLYRTRVMLGGKLRQCYGKTAAEATAKRVRLVRDWEQGLEPLEARYTVNVAELVTPPPKAPKAIPSAFARLGRP